MFRSRKRSLGNTAALATPAPTTEPTPTVNHYYSPSYTGLVFVAFLVLAGIVILGWYGLVFLFEQAGANNPAYSAANCLIGVGAILGLIFILSLAAKYFLNDFYIHREQMMDRRVELERARMQAVQFIPPVTRERMTHEESRKYLAVKVVMSNAYLEVDEQGKLKGKVEPWSRREVGRIRLMNELEEIGENTLLASWVKRYLLKNRILISDRQVNLTDFPNLAAVEAQLVKDFGPPIIYQAGSSGGMSTHYIDPATGKSSWG